MVIARVNIKDKGAKDFKSVVIAEIRELEEKDTRRLAEETQKIIQDEIRSSIRRMGSTDKLASSFIAEKIVGMGITGWGVGDIDYLNRNVPYWRHCLSEDTEVYIYLDNKIISCSLKKLFNLWHFNKDIKILTPNGLKSIINMREILENEYYIFDFARYFSVKMSKFHKLIYKLNGRLIEKEAQNFGSSLLQYSAIYTGLPINDSIVQTKIKIDNVSFDLDYLYGWIIGFTLAEGHLSKNRITWTQNNIDNIQEKLQEFAHRFNYELKIYKENKRTIFCINHKIIYKFIHCFCSGTKTNKKITNFYLNTPEQFRKGILDGYNIGDGRRADTNKYHIRTISKEMCHQLMLIGASLGYDISLLKSQKQSDKSFKSNYPLYSAYIYTYCRRWQVKDFQATEIFQEKKYCTRNERGLFNRSIGKKVNFCYFPKSIIKVNHIFSKENFIDIAVEDELFLINGGVISHNCNYGSEAIGANWKHWLPKGRWVNDRWVADDTGFWFMPSNPIPAMNYIEKTIAQIDTIIDIVLAEK